MVKRCVDCRHFESEEEDSSDGHYGKTWVACLARKGVANFKQFPFVATACKYHKSKEGQAE